MPQCERKREGGQGGQIDDQITHGGIGTVVQHKVGEVEAGQAMVT